MLLRTKKTQILLQRFPDSVKDSVPKACNSLPSIGTFLHPNLQIIVKGPNFRSTLRILLLTCDGI